MQSRWIVRQGKWKLIFGRNRLWLFDLSAQSPKQKNLAEKHPGLVRELQDLHKEWIQEMSSSP